jgi:hypothetical protein
MSPGEIYDILYVERKSGEKFEILRKIPVFGRKSMNQ